MNIVPPTDQEIQAFVDNQLSWEDEKKVRAAIAQYPFAQKRERELRQMNKLMRGWFEKLS